MKFVHRVEVSEPVFALFPVANSLDTIVVFESGSVAVLDAQFQLGHGTIDRDAPPHWARLVQDQAGRVLLSLHRVNELVHLSVFAVRARDADDAAAASGSVSVELMCEHKFTSAMPIISFAFELEKRTMVFVTAAGSCFVYRFSSVAALLRASSTTLELTALVGEPQFVHSWQVACYDVDTTSTPAAAVAAAAAAAGLRRSRRNKREKSSTSLSAASQSAAGATAAALANVAPIQAALINPTALLLVGKAKDESHCVISLWSTEYGALLLSSIVAGAVNEKGVTAPLISSTRRSLVALIDVGLTRDADEQDDGHVLHCSVFSSRIRLVDMLMSAERTAAAVVEHDKRAWSGTPPVVDLSAMLSASVEQKSYRLAHLAVDTQHATHEQTLLKRLRSARDEAAALRVCQELLANVPSPQGSVYVSSETAVLAAETCIENRWRKPLACVVRTRALSAAACDGVLALALDDSDHEKARLDLLAACLECQGDIGARDIVRLLKFALAPSPSDALIERICNGAQASPAEAIGWFVDRILLIECDRAALHRHLVALDAFTCERLLAHLRRRLTCLSVTLGDDVLTNQRLAASANAADKLSSSMALDIDSQSEAAAHERATLKHQRRAPSALASRVLPLDAAIQWLEALLDARAHTLARRSQSLEELHRVQQLLQHEVGICDVLAPAKGYLFEILNTHALRKARAVDETPSYCIEVLKL